MTTKLKAQTLSRVLTALLADTSKLTGVYYYRRDDMHPSFPLMVFERLGFKTTFFVNQNGDEALLMSLKIVFNLEKAGVRLAEALGDYPEDFIGELSATEPVSLHCLDTGPASFIESLVVQGADVIVSGQVPQKWDLYSLRGNTRRAA